MIVAALMVGCGGFVGAMLRFCGVTLVQRLIPLQHFPVGTLAVNVVGCFAIGWLNGYAEARHALTPEVRLFLLVGVLGGFTTYSAFAWETLELGHEGLSLHAVANVALHVALGLAAVWAGVALHRTA